jgi:hypothetical protein
MEWPDDAFWSPWAERTGTHATNLRGNVWYGPDIEATNVGHMHRDARPAGLTSY